MILYRFKNNRLPCEIVSRDGDLAAVQFLDGKTYCGVHVSHLTEIVPAPEQESPDHTCSVCGIDLEPWESVRCAACHEITF